jgi:hypothetical protein
MLLAMHSYAKCQNLGPDLSKETKYFDEKTGIFGYKLLSRFLDVMIRCDFISMCNVLNVTRQAEVLVVFIRPMKLHPQFSSAAF